MPKNHNNMYENITQNLNIKDNVVLVSMIPSLSVVSLKAMSLVWGT